MATLFPKDADHLSAFYVVDLAFFSSVFFAICVVLVELVSFLNALRFCAQANAGKRMTAFSNASQEFAGVVIRPPDEKAPHAWW